MSELKEIWRDIEDYDELYQVSNFGRVRSWINNSNNRRKIPKILKSAKNKHGYLYVNLCKKGKQRVLRVHRLVAQAFIPNPENKPEINHINGIKTDNRVSNLEWITQKENIAHAIKNNLIPLGELRYNAKLTNEQVKKIRQQYIPYSQEFGTHALARKYAVSRKTIISIVHHKSYKNI